MKKIQWQGGLEFPGWLSVQESIELLQHIRQTTGYHLNYTHKRNETNIAPDHVSTFDYLFGRFSKGFPTLTPEAVFPFVFKRSGLTLDNSFAYFNLASRIPKNALRPDIEEETAEYAQRILKTAKNYLDAKFPNETHRTIEYPGISIEEALRREDARGFGRLALIAIGLPIGHGQ